MRCECCDRMLSDYESTLRHAVTQKFLDTCTGCLKDLGIPFRGREELKKVPTYEDPVREDDRGWVDDYEEE